MLYLTARARSDRLRELSARLYRLSEMTANPARSHLQVESIINEGEEAMLLLAVERSKPGTVDPSKIDAIRQVARGTGA